MSDTKKIVIVGKDSACNFNTIQEALDNVEEDSVIQVKPGIYNEDLIFKKKVHLIGCNESIKDKSSLELPILVFDPDKTCEIDVPVEVAGIVFTHKKDLQFDKLSSYVDTPLEFEKKEYEDSKSLLLVKSESSFTNIAILCAEYHGITFSGLKSIINNSFISHNYFTGIYTRNNSELVINNCIVSDSKLVGIQISDSATPKIENCTINDNKSCGIYIIQESSPTINNCIICNNKNNGVLIFGDCKPIVYGCEIFASEDGIYLDGNSNLKIVKSFIYDNKNHGLVYNCSSKSPKVIACLCEIYNSYIGVYIPPYGITSESLDNGIYERCIIHNCEGDGVALYEKNKLTLKDCVICENRCGVNVSDGILELKGSEIYKNSDFGIKINTDFIGIYDNCNIHHNSTGIFSLKTNKPDFATCKVCDNAKGNIVFLKDFENMLEL